MNIKNKYSPFTTDELHSFKKNMVEALLLIADLVDKLNVLIDQQTKIDIRKKTI